MVLTRYPDTKITEALMIVATNNSTYDNNLMEVLLKRYPDIEITEAGVQAEGWDSDLDFDINNFMSLFPPLLSIITLLIQLLSFLRHPIPKQESSLCKRRMTHFAMTGFPDIPSPAPPALEIF